MCGFIRRFSKFRIALTLIVLTVVLRQVGGRIDLIPYKTQASVGSAVPEKAYSEPRVVTLGESIHQELSASERHAYRISLSSGQYLRLLIAQSGIKVGMTLFAPDGQKLSEFICRENGPTPVSAI